MTQMRITIGRGKNRQSIEFPSGPNVGVSKEHVSQMLTIMRQHGIRI